MTEPAPKRRRDPEAARRRTNWAILLALVAFCVLMFAVAIVKMARHG